MSKTRKSQSRFPLSATQKGFYFLQQMDLSSPVLNMVRLDEIRGELNEEKLDLALSKAIKQYDIFRTKFEQTGEALEQVVLGANEIHFKMDSQRAHSKEDVLERASQLGQIPFDLEKPPLIKVTLFKIAPQYYVLVRVIHHIVSDFKTNRLFLEAVMRGYDNSDLNEVAHFGEYTRWEEENLTDSKLKEDIQYWKEKLSHVSECLHLPLDKPRPAVLGSNFKMKTQALSPEVWKNLKALSQTIGVSHFQMGLSAFFLFLHRYSGDEDICLGSNIDFRKARHLPNLIGPGINPFLVRNQYSPLTSFNEFAKLIASNAKEAYRHSDVSLDKLIRTVNPPRNPGHAALFQAIFDYWASEPSIKGSGLKISRMDYAWLHGQADLYCRITENNEVVTLWFRYNADLFEGKTIETMLHCFSNLMEEIASHPQEKVSHLRLISKTEEKKYLDSICGQTEDYEKCSGIQNYFERQVDLTPKNIALEWDGKTLTYDELEQKSNQLAHFLRHKGVGPDVFVGLLLDRSFEMFISILGILKAGGAYVPMDPAYPLERLIFLLSDIQAPVLLTQKHLFKEEFPRSLCVDSEWDQVGNFPVTRLECVNSLDNAAYMIYTSGSTGNPKDARILIKILQIIFSG